MAAVHALYVPPFNDDLLGQAMQTYAELWPYVYGHKFTPAASVGDIFALHFPLFYFILCSFTFRTKEYWLRHLSLYIFIYNAL